jgi:DNA-binding LytR/AlgR family response regulator
MSSPTLPCAVVAEDEPVLARTLVRLLHEAWPGLRIAAVASDGPQAVALALEHTPQLLFLDIRMPGRSGLEVAEAVADDWPDGQPLPLIVFVTAYDEFAVAAFERAAVDYVLKPATAQRLAVTVLRLQERLAQQPQATTAPS